MTPTELANLQIGDVVQVYSKALELVQVGMVSWSSWTRSTNKALSPEYVEAGSLRLMMTNGFGATVSDHLPGGSVLGRMTDDEVDLYLAPPGGREERKKVRGDIILAIINRRSLR